MCFTDLAKREHELRVFGKVASVIRTGAQKAGHTRIEFLEVGTMMTYFSPAQGAGVEIGNRIGQIHVLHNLDLDRRHKCTRPRTCSTLTSSTLGIEQINVQTIFVDVPGYDQMLFNIPSSDLMKFHFPTNCAATESRLRIILDDLNEGFPFAKYRDDWSHFGPPTPTLAVA